MRKRVDERRRREGHAVISVSKGKEGKRVASILPSFIR
jgi:hypothetical protein